MFRVFLLLALLFPFVVANNIEDDTRSDTALQGEEQTFYFRTCWLKNW